MCSTIKKHMWKNLFQGIASIILCKRYVPGNIKDGVTK